MKKNNVESMRKVFEVQGSNGNWNYNEYMFGMYNGMEMMMSIIENREATFRARPREWIKDRIEETDIFDISSLYPTIMEEQENVKKNGNNIKDKRVGRNKG